MSRRTSLFSENSNELSANHADGLIPLPSHNLLWTGIASGIEEGHQYLWRDYVMGRHRTTQDGNRDNSFFIYFNKQQSRILLRDHDMGPKFHIALREDDCQNVNSDIQSVFNSILNVLDKHRIESFKVVLPSKLDEFLREGKFGKIFTIYLGKLCNDEQKTLANDLERAITGARRYPPVEPPEMRATECGERRDEAYESHLFVTQAQNRSEKFRYRCPSDLFKTNLPPSFGGGGGAAASRDPSDLRGGAVLRDISDLLFDPNDPNFVSYAQPWAQM